MPAPSRTAAGSGRSTGKRTDITHVRQHRYRAVHSPSAYGAYPMPLAATNRAFEDAQIRTSRLAAASRRERHFPDALGAPRRCRIGRVLGHPSTTGGAPDCDASARRRGAGPSASSASRTDAASRTRRIECSVPNARFASAQAQGTALLAWRHRHVRQPARVLRS